MFRSFFGLLASSFLLYLLLVSSLHFIFKIPLSLFLIAAILLFVGLFLAEVALYLRGASGRNQGGSDEESLLYRLKESYTNEVGFLESVLIGHIYRVTTKGDLKTELWFTDDDTGWNLKSKFGYWYYKRRVKPHESDKFYVEKLISDVAFDPLLHKKIEGACTAEEMRLRRERFKRQEKNQISLYLYVDRISKKFTLIPVPHDKESLLKDDYPIDRWCELLRVSSDVGISQLKNRTSSANLELRYLSLEDQMRVVGLSR